MILLVLQILKKNDNTGFTNSQKIPKLGGFV